MPRRKLAKQKKFRLSDLDLDLISLVPAGDDPMAQVVLSKTAPDKTTTGNSARGTVTTRKNQPEEGDDMADEITKDDLPDEVVTYIEALEDEVDSLRAEKKEPTKKSDPSDVDEEEDDEDEDDEDEAETSKGDPLAKADPAVKALIEKQAKAISKAEKRAEAAEAVAKAERKERLRKEFVEKAKTLPMISDTPDDFGALLEEASEKLSEDDYKKFEGLLKAANEQITKSNLFDEIGNGGLGSVNASVEAKANELRKADPTLSEAQAIARAYEMNPALYDEEV